MTDNPFEAIQNSIGESSDIWRTHPVYYLFEPWSVTERPKSVLEQAVADDVNLYSDDMLRCVGKDPHPFQDGYLLSTHHQRTLFAGNQLGKTVAVGIEVLASTTAEIPISMRYPVGYDTGIPRIINKPNIIRWGRRSKDTGKILDHNWRAIKDGSWDCGNVTGAGVFPSEKIVAPGTTVRLGSYQRLIMQNWWPAFAGQRGQLGSFVPEHFIDKTRGPWGTRGFNKMDKQVYLSRGCTLQMLTYEAGKEGFEGIKVPTYLDEEPPNEDIIGSVVLHAKHWSLIETPYLGFTFSEKFAFPEHVSPHAKTFHATAYDCPYMTEDDIAKARSSLEDRPWELGPRLYGVPAAQKGRPFFDRAKINLWISNYRPPYELFRFEPAEQCEGIKTDLDRFRHPGLLDVEIKRVPCDKEDLQCVWRVYEDRHEGQGYCNASDQADGAEVPGLAGDYSFSVMGRPGDEDPQTPTICATLRSTLPVMDFAMNCMYAARYYNNALLAPESAKGAANEGFAMVCREWPWWFKDVVTSFTSGRRQKVQLGFCPTQGRRDTIFDVLIRGVIDRHGPDDYPGIPDEWILKELAAAIVGFTRGKMATRCDHTKSGTLDGATAYGILLYAHQKEFIRQIRCHGNTRKDGKSADWLTRMLLDEEEQHESASGGWLGEKDLMPKR